MLLSNNKYFLIPYCLFLLTGALVLLLFSKTEVHLFINKYYNSFSDYFFRYSTFLAEGGFIVVVILAIAFFNVRNSLLLLSSWGFSSIITQFLKRIIFNDYPRPKAFFEGLANLRFVEGVTVHSSFSFPSGHATASFAVFFSLAILLKKDIYKLLMFFCAFLVAWSRIHLSQHFLIDIYFGSVIGISGTLLVFWFFENRDIAGNKMDVPIQTLFRRKNEIK